MKTSMIIEQKGISEHYICKYCVVDLTKDEGMVECFESILIYHSEDRARMDGWTTLGDRWVCPE